MDNMISTQNMPSQGPLTGPSQESKMHKAAEGLIGTFLAQMVGEMLNEVAESSEESSEESKSSLDAYNGWLAEGMGEKIAQSGSAKSMVDAVKKKMYHHQAGLDDLKTTSSAAGASGAYANMTTTMKMKETNNVCAAAA